MAVNSADKNREMRARPASAGEVRQLVGLAGLMFESMGVDASGDDWQREAADRLRGRLGDDMVVFVVDDADGHPVACAAGVINSRFPTPVNPSGQIGYVQWVSTEPEWRRKGASRAAMEALLAWFDDRGVASVELHATADGEPLYRSLGFGDDGRNALRRKS